MKNLFRVMRQAAVVIFAVLDTIAAFTNFAILCIILPKTCLRTVSNLLLAGLALTDLAMTLLVVPFSIVTFATQSWRFSEGFCVFQGFSMNFLSISSATFVSVIAVDRFYYLANPMGHSANVSGKLVSFAAAFCWFHSAFWASFPLFGIEGLSYNYVPAKQGCGFRWHLRGACLIYYYFISMASFLLPSFTLCLMYFKSLQAARRSAQQIRPGNIQIQVLQNGEFTSVTQTNNHFHSLKANCTLTLITLSFFISRGPLAIFNLASNSYGEGKFSPIAQTAVSFMLFLAPLLDSLVYTLLNRKLRKRISLIFRKCFKKESFEEEPKDILQYLRTLTDNYVSSENGTKHNSRQTSRSTMNVNLVEEFASSPTPRQNSLANNEGRKQKRRSSFWELHWLTRIAPSGM